MKKKGFTLIELLAVIVILAIIALIITPIVSDIIKSSSKAAAMRSVEGYISAANNEAAISLVDPTGITVTKDKYSFETGEDNAELNKIVVSGNKPNYVYLEYDAELQSVVYGNFCQSGFALDYDNGKITDGVIDYCSTSFVERPKIVVSAPNKLNSKVTMSIEFTANTVSGKYKIGTGEYIDYTEPIEIESSRELASQRDEHGNLKVCAKAILNEGESEICRTLIKLDLDYPDAPTIDAAGGYPVITTYGVVTGMVTIVPAPNDEITPFVSVDGINWRPYESSMGVTGNTIYAKIVKNESGLESEVSSITTTTPSDALNSNAYDGNLSTYSTLVNKKIYIDDAMRGEKIKFTFTTPSQRTKGYIFYDENNDEILRKELSRRDGTTSIEIEIPSNTKYMSAYEACNLYNIEPYTEPTIINDGTYPILKSSGLQTAYATITINYYRTGVQKLYRINEGDWLNYTGSFRAELGQKIEAKSIDKNGTDSYMIELVAHEADDALGKAAYDNDTTTYSELTGKKIYIDSSMQGKKINYTYTAPSARAKGCIFYDENNQEISRKELSRYDSPTLVEIEIPSGTKYMSAFEVSRVHEISPVN